MIDIDYYQLLLLYRLTTSGYLYPKPALVLHFAPSLCFTLSLQSAFYPLSAVCSPQSSFYTDRYQKSIDIIDINRFNPPINIDWYQKSIEIEVTEKVIDRLSLINKIDRKMIIDF